MGVVLFKNPDLSDGLQQQTKRKRWVNNSQRIENHLLGAGAVNKCEFYFIFTLFFVFFSLFWVKVGVVFA